ncbi:MAG: hypothetical protein QOH73_312 [Gaiellaceae bacterium]|jgi:hypothetical protein|nr:hypothetical protein [Gaiellaceae bacterium]
MSSEDFPREEFDLHLASRLLSAGSQPDDADWLEVVERAAEIDPGARLAAAGRGPNDGNWDAIRARARQLAWRGRPLRAVRHVHRRRHVRLVALTATMAVAALALLFTPKTPATLIERAAAAVPGTGQIVHVIWEEADPHSLVDVGTGARLGAPPLRVEAWYDRRDDIYHEVATQGDALVWERWHSPQETLDSTEGDLPSWQFAVPAAIRFFSHYKQALAQGRALLAGKGHALGRPVYWLVVDTTVQSEGPGSSLAFGRVNERDRIALDRQTLTPVEVETVDSGILGDASVRRRVIDFELEPTDKANLSRPIVRPWPQPVRDLDGYATPRATGLIETLDDAAKVLRAKPLALRFRLAGLPLTWVHADELNPEATPLRQGVRILYGATREGGQRNLRGHYVQLDEALQPELAYAFRPYDAGNVAGQMAVSHDVPQDVSQAQRGVGAQALQREWVGRLEAHGLFVTIHASSYQLLLDAARVVVDES